MSRLLVGFDSAWTATNSGGLASALIRGDGTLQELGLPATVDYNQAQRMILDWQTKLVRMDAAGHAACRSVTQIQSRADEDLFEI